MTWILPTLSLLIRGRLDADADYDELKSKALQMWCADLGLNAHVQCASPLCDIGRKKFGSKYICMQV